MDGIWYNKKFLEFLVENIKDNHKYKEEITMIKRRISNLDLIIETSLELENEKETFIDKIDYKYDVKKFLNISYAKLTAIIIVKDEERCIKRCITSIIDQVDAIIVVDTGCTDDTIKIIKNLKSNKIKIYNYEWQDDFASARNFGIDQVNNGWIIFIDADEYLDDKINLKICINEFNNITNINNLTICPVIKNQNDNNFITVRRIFKKESEIYFYGKIHEEPRRKNEKLQYLSLNIAFQHDGYSIEILNAKKKLERNYRLLKEMILIEKDNPRWIYFLIRDGGIYIEEKEMEQMAFKVLLNKLENGMVIENLRRHEYTFPILDILARRYLQSKNLSKLNNIIQIIDKIYPENTNTIYYIVMSKIIEMKNEVNRLLLKVIDYRKRNYDVQPGMLHSKGYHIDFLIAILLFENANYKEAFKYFDFLENKFIDESFVNKYKKIFEVKEI